MLYAQTILENETSKIVSDFEIQTDHPISVRRPDLVLIDKKKTKKTPKPCNLEDFGISANHRVKMKESEKINKYLDLAREQKNLWNMMLIQFFGGILQTVPKEWRNWKSEVKKLRPSRSEHC